MPREAGAAPELAQGLLTCEGAVPAGYLLVVSTRLAKTTTSATPLVACVPGHAGSLLKLGAAVRRTATTFLFKLDGSAATSLSCYVLEKGASIRTTLTELATTTLAARCKTEVADLTEAAPAAFETLDPNSVCASASEIAAVARELATAIDAGRTCD